MLRSSDNRSRDNRALSAKSLAVFEFVHDLRLKGDRRSLRALAKDWNRNNTEERHYAEPWDKCKRTYDEAPGQLLSPVLTLEMGELVVDPATSEAGFT
jgi:hypothetical protein